MDVDTLLSEMTVAIERSLAASDEAPAEKPAAPKPQSYLTVTFDPAQRAALNEAFLSAQAAAGVAESHTAKQELHVTLWHPGNYGPGEGLQLREQLLAMQGKQVQFHVQRFHHTPTLSAAEVAVAEGALGSAALDCTPHITMFHARGVNPALAGPMVRDGTGAAVPLAEPLAVVGTVVDRPLGRPRPRK